MKFSWDEAKYMMRATAFAAIQAAIVQLDALRGVYPPLSADEKIAKLISTHSNQYYTDMGRDILQQLQLRCTATPYNITDSNSAHTLGKTFPVLNYRPLIARLVHVLYQLETNLLFQDDPGNFQATYHILELQGPPGSGKTTAGQLAWVALCQALSSSNNEVWKPHLADQECWDRLCTRVQASFKPDCLLLFKLDFSKGGLDEFAVHEQQLLQQRWGEPWQRILAWRMLYATLTFSQQQSQTYSQLLANMDVRLRDNLEPTDVIAFVRQRVGLADDQDVMMVWMLDGAHNFARQPPAWNTPEGLAIRPTTYLQHLLSAFVKQRCRQLANTMPICLLTSPMHCSIPTGITLNNSALVAHFHLVPLSPRQCSYILSAAAARVNMTGPATPLPDGIWPTINLKPSSSLPDVQLNDSAQRMLELCCGNPQMLAYCLSCMVGVPPGNATTKLTLGLLPQWCQTGGDMELQARAAMGMLVSAIKGQQAWADFIEDSTPAKKRLVQVMAAHALVMYPVERTARVLRDQPWTWECMEHEGLCSLTTTSGQLSRVTDEDVGLLTAAAAKDTPFNMYVIMTPLLMAACIENNRSQFLDANVDTKEAYVHAVASIIFRTCWASSYLKYDVMDLAQVILGMSYSATADSIAVATAALGKATLQKLKDKVVVAPHRQLKLQKEDGQVDTPRFVQLLKNWIANDLKPYAFFGPQNVAWLFFRQYRKEKPLVVFVSSNHSESGAVDADKIKAEMVRNVFGSGDVECENRFDLVYIYIADQEIESVPDDPHVVVIPPQLHQSFYGTVQQLLRLSRAMPQDVAWLHCALSNYQVVE